MAIIYDEFGELAAMTLTTLTTGERTGLVFFRGLGSALLLILSVVVALLTVCTVRAAVRDEIWVPE